MTKLINNKYTNLFKISFFSYPVAILVSSYVTARMWADISIFIFAICLIYQLCYLIFLRRKEDVSFSKSMSILFRYGISMLSIYIIIYYIDIYINGYCWSFLSSCELKYGIDAIMDDISFIIFIPWLILNQLIFIFYYRKYKKRQVPFIAISIILIIIFLYLYHY